jgi:hypothetical protein
MMARWRELVVGVVLVLTACLAVGVSPAAGEALCEQAQALVQSGRLDAAEVLLDAAAADPDTASCPPAIREQLSANRDRAEALADEGAAAARAGDYSTATKKYEEARKLDSQWADELAAVGDRRDAAGAELSNWWERLRDRVLIPVVTVVAVLALAFVFASLVARALGAFYLTVFNDRVPRFPTGAYVPIAGLALAGLLWLLYSEVPRPGVLAWGVWVRIGLLAVALVALTALWSASRLRLAAPKIEDDTTGLGDAITAELMTLTASTPRGLEVVAGTDVASLSVDGLAEFTGNKLVGAVLTALNAVTPQHAIEVHGTLSGKGYETVLRLQLRRGSRVLDAITLDAAAYRPLHVAPTSPDAGTAGEDAVHRESAAARADLAVGAAAWLLVATEKLHVKPNFTGLYGATECASVTFQELAARRARAGNDDDALRLFAAAVDCDPKNQAARFGLATTKLWQRVPDEPQDATITRWQRALARLVEMLPEKERARLDQEPAWRRPTDADPFEAVEPDNLLWHRLRYAVAAGYVHLGLARPSGPDGRLTADAKADLARGLSMAGVAAATIDDALGRPPSRFGDAPAIFLEGLRPAVLLLERGATLLNDPGEPRRLASELDLGRLSLRAAYNRACYFASPSRSADGTLEYTTVDAGQAVAALAMAAIQPDLARWAWEDPSLAHLRAHDRDEFVRAAGPGPAKKPALALATWPLIGPCAESLAKPEVGITTVAVLRKRLESDPQGVAAVAGLRHVALRRWRDLLGLSEVVGEDPGLLSLLVAAGVEARADLSGPAGTLHARLEQAREATGSVTAVPEIGTIEQWLAAVSQPATA